RRIAAAGLRRAASGRPLLAAARLAPHLHVATRRGIAADVLLPVVDVDVSNVCDRPDVGLVANDDGTSVVQAVVAQIPARAEPITPARIARKPAMVPPVRSPVGPCPIAKAVAGADAPGVRPGIVHLMVPAAMVVAGAVDDRRAIDVAAG